LFYGGVRKAVPFFIKRYLFYKEKFYKKLLYKRMCHKKKYNICGRLCNRRQRVKEWNPEEFLREQAARKQKDKKIYEKGEYFYVISNEI